MDPYETQNKKRQRAGIVLLGVIAVIMIASIAYILFGGNTPQPTEDTGTSTVSPTSPSTSTATADNSNETANNSSLDGLLDRGFSSEQISATQAAIYKFAAANKKDIKTLAVDNTNIVRKEASDGRPYYTVPIHFSDDKQYTVRIIAVDLLSIRLYVDDGSTGTQIFDSKVTDYTGKVTE